MDDFRSPVFFEITSEETGNTRPGLDANQEFYLEARLTVTFWANRAQYECARELAETVLVHRLYGDILGELSELKLQISNGDRGASMLAVSRLEQKLCVKSK
jgi:hypothetical protein